MFAPPEILSMIASYLPRSSIGDFRLTNKTFAIVGLPYLIPSVTIKLLPESLSRFTKISQHPVFSQYVAEIVLIKDVVRDCTTILQWKDSIHRARPWPVIPKPDDPKELHIAYEAAMERTWGLSNDYRFEDANANIGWHCQQEVRALQETLIEPGLPKLMQCITDALPRLPRLRAVRLLGCIDGMDSLGHPLLKPVHQQRYRYCESLSFEGLLVGVDQLRSMLICADRSPTTKLKHLSAYELHGELFNPQYENFQSLCNGATSLRSLDLDFGLANHRVYGGWLARDYEEYILQFEQGGIKLFLEGLNSLQALKLWFGTIGDLRHCPKFEYILVGLKLPVLQSLDIAKLQVRSKEFLQFLSDHVSTMKRIRLKDLHLIDEEPACCWSAIFDAMRSELTLEGFEVKGRLDSVSPKSSMHTSSTILQHPTITVSELLMSFVLNKDRADLFGESIHSTLNLGDAQKLAVEELKILLDSVDSDGS